MMGQIKEKLADKAELQQLISAFHLMWDNFPEPVCMTHKSFEVVAVNPACKLINREPGMICIKQGSPEAHKGCLAQKALKEQKTEYVRKESNGVETLTYWLTIDGYPDYFIHLGTRVTIDYK